MRIFNPILPSAARRPAQCWHRRRPLLAVALAILAVAALLIPPAGAELKLASSAGALNFSIPTTDYFEYATDPGAGHFASARILTLQSPPDPAPPCAFIPATDPVYSSAVERLVNAKKVGGFANLLLYLPRRVAVSARCGNYADMVRAASRFSASLDDVKLPAASWVLVESGMPAGAVGVVGGPFLDPYLPHTVFAADGSLRLPTAIIDSASAAQLEKALAVGNGADGDSLMFDAQTETGPWNAVFLSTGFRVFRWIHFSACVLVVVLGMLQLFGIMWRSSVSLDVRFQVLCLSQLATIVYLIASSLAWHSWSRILLDNVAGLLFNLSLNYILVFWFRILRMAKILVFGPVILPTLGVSTLAAIYLFAARLVDSVRPLDDISVLLVVIGFSAVAFTYLVMLCLFAFNSYRLMQLRAVVERQVSPDAFAVLLRLGILVPLFVVCSWAHCIIAALLAYVPTVPGSVNTVAVMWVADRVTTTLQAACFVLGLSLRVLGLPSINAGGTGGDKSSSKNLADK